MIGPQQHLKELLPSGEKGALQLVADAGGNKPFHG